jgi:hypothetical protein
MSETQEVRTEVAVEGTQEQRQRTWVKVVLGADLPPRRRINVGSAGSSPVAGQARVDEQRAAPDMYQAKYGPLREKLRVSLARTHRVQLDGDVRDAESCAFQAASEAETAAAAGNWTAALVQLGKLEMALTTLAATYDKAADAVDAKVDKDIRKLAGKAQQIGAKDKLSMEGLDVSSAEASRYGLIQARAVANREALGVERLVTLTRVLDAVKAASANMDRELKTQGNQALVAGSTELRDQAAAAIKRLPAGEPKTTLTASLADWDERKQAADALKDVDALQAACVALDAAARDLLDRALAAAGGKKGDVTKEKAYRKALVKRYGIDIEIPSGMKNTHLDRVYEMFGQLPVQHTKTDSLAQLEYGRKPNKASFGGATINIGDFGDATRDWKYKEPANGFNISTLHEVGHSVDDRYKIMTSHRSDRGCGGWKEETLDGIAKAMAEDFKANAGKDTTLTTKDVLTHVKAALKKGTVKVPRSDGRKKKKVPEYDVSDKPGGVTNADWSVLQVLLNNCVKIRTTEWPWARMLASLSTIGPITNPIRANGSATIGARAMGRRCVIISGGHRANGSPSSTPIRGTRRRRRPVPYPRPSANICGSRRNRG